MDRKEKLKNHLEKIKELKTRLDLLQQEWVAYNRLFNEWMQQELGVQGDKTELHLTEILYKWDESNDNSSKIDC